MPKRNIKNNLAGSSSISEILQDNFNVSEKVLNEAMSGVTSIAEIYNYNKEEIQEKYVEIDGFASKFDVKIGTNLLVDEEVFENVNRLKNPKPIKIFNDRKYTGFLAKQIKELVSSPSYNKRISTDDILKKNTALTGDYATKLFTNVRVVVWSKSQKELIDCSDFVTDINTNVGDGGGNFSINLAAIRGFTDSEGNPVNVNKRSQDTGYVRSHTIWRGVQRMILGEGNAKIITNPNEKTNVEQYYWNIALSPNDMVFIKFEPFAFEFELNRAELQKKLQLVTKLEDLETDYWDMIGLADEIVENSNRGAADVNFELKGRDLSKLMIEDGVYFFPFTRENGSNFINNVSDAEVSTKPYKRLWGEIVEITLLGYKSLETVANFIFTRFGNIEIIPDTETNFITADNDSMDFDKGGIWRYFNIMFDKETAKRQLIDAGVKTGMGSLMNFLQNIAEPQFVEMIMDTYGQRYYMMFRKPPIGEHSYYQNYAQIAGGKGINIEEKHISSMNVKKYGRTAYSWYRLFPKGAFFGDEKLAKLYMPAVFFKEYAEVFGSKALEVNSNYIALGSDYGKKTVNAAIDEATKDLRWMVETNAYLPFTREGTISIIGGDRSIKKGMTIYVPSTDELYYVKSVSQSYSVMMDSTNRTTNVEVERGMVLRYYDKYFNLIDNLDKDSSQWKVNQHNFEFLLNNKQFVSR